MTREHFLMMLKSPSVIDLNRVKDLEDIAEQFPYFQNVHLLLARQYYGHENIRYESYLKKAAIYASDRKKLYNLIRLPATEVVHMQPAASEDVIEQTDIQTPEIPVEQGGNQNQFQSVPSEVNAIPVSKTQMEESEDPRKILEIRLNELNRRTDPEVVKKEHQQEKISEEVESTPIKEVKTISEASPFEIKQTPQPPTEQTYMSFLDWLRVKNVPVAPASETRDYFGEALQHAENEKPPAEMKPDSTFEPGSIIEKFIREEPRIAPAKSEFYSPGNMARKSLIEHDDMISETLAIIYARQGNKIKAAETYKKLGLKFPEKSAYFAALAKKMEEGED
ncbi:MAG TPA: hypothetical protein VFW78_10860 [Bacteroidia bacterium]|nr:hypothetical protein [Bacteroidia bacterium]